MKKLLLFTAIVVLGFTSVNAQGEFRVGLNAGLPLGDASDFSSLALAADVGYLFGAPSDFNFGLETGFSCFLGKDGAENFEYIPVLAIGNYDLSDDFSVEGGAGYAISLKTGGGGDFTWKIGVAYDTSEKDDIYLSYRSVSGGNGFSVDGLFLGYRRTF